jgi:hypothetical protein
MSRKRWPMDVSIVHEICEEGNRLQRFPEALQVSHRPRLNRVGTYHFIGEDGQQLIIPAMPASPSINSSSSFPFRACGGEYYDRKIMYEALNKETRRLRRRRLLRKS